MPPDADNSSAQPSPPNQVPLPLPPPPLSSPPPAEMSLAFVDTPSLPKFSKGAEAISKNVGTGGPPAAQGRCPPAIQHTSPPLSSPALPLNCTTLSRANKTTCPPDDPPPPPLSPGSPTQLNLCSGVHGGG